MISPQLSIIVPSYNGKDKVIRLLHALEHQSFLSFEVIVVLDGSTDGTAQAIKSKQWNAFPLKIIEQKNKGRAGARNTGAAHATTELLLFFDDDLLFDSNCIEMHIAALATKTNTIFMGQVIEPCKSSDTEIKHYKNYLNQSWAAILEPFRNKMIPSHLTILSAQNVSMPKQLFNTLTGFDERLKDIEDYDFALRAKAAHISVFYLDIARAIHRDFFNFQKYANRSKDYLANRKLASNLKPELYKNDPILTHKISFSQRIVYSILKFPFWLWILDNFNFFKLVYPKSLRYKLYSIIITAYVHKGKK